MSLRTVGTWLAGEWPLVLIGLLGVAGVALAIDMFVSKAPTRQEKAAQSDVQLANGDPTWNTVNVYHDGRRGVTCYVETNHGGIACFLDITLEDQQRMLAYRDGGR
jgi:hypothetical protein